MKRARPSPANGAIKRFGSATPKSDGVIVSHNATTLGDMEGVGDTREIPDRAPFEEGIVLLAPAFAKLKAVRA